MLKRYLRAFSLGMLAALGSLQVGLAAELAEIRARGKLIVAVKDNLRPLGFRDDGGRLQGFEIELARRLAAELLGDADAIVLVPISNQERLQALLEDRVDLVVAQLSATPTRNRVIEFSSAYYLERTAIVTADDAIAGWADLASKQVAVLAGSQTATSLPSELPEGATPLVVASYQEALARLDRGDAAAFAGDTSVLAGWIQEFPRYRLIPLSAVDFVPRGLSVGMPKGSQYAPLRQQVNAAIARWQQSGWLVEARRRWGLP